MGTTQTLRPNGNISGTGAFSLVGGGATVWGNLSDNSDATKVQRTSSGDRTGSLTLGTYTLGASERVKQIRAAARVTFSNKPVYYEWGWGNDFAGPVDFRTRQAKNTAVTTYYTSWVDAALAADGTPLQADIDSLYMWIRDKASSALNYFHDVWLELDVIDRPTVTVATPSTSTLRPTISFTYADGDGDPQTYYQVKVFSAAQYGAGGFDPATSTATWDSGLISGDVATARPDVPLANSTTYKAYVQVAHEGGLAGPYYSAWTASAAWTVSITPTTTPTINSVTYNANLGRVRVNVTGAAPPAGVTQTLRVERSDDGGTTWTAVRDWTAGPFGSPYSKNVDDYEYKVGTTPQYRARVLGVNASGDDVSSPWSSTGSVAVAASVWYLKCPVDSSMNVTGVSVLQEPSITVDETIGVFEPLGGTKKVTVAGDEYGQDGAFEIRATTDMAAVEVIVLAQQVLYVQDPFGGNKCIRITDRSRPVQGTPAAPRTVWSVSYVEVAQPAVE